MLNSQMWILNLLSGKVNNWKHLRGINWCITKSCKDGCAGVCWIVLFTFKSCEINVEPSEETHKDIRETS